jgi:hypothetical protein
VNTLKSSLLHRLLLCGFLANLATTVPVDAAEAPGLIMQNAPHVFWASDPVLPNDTVMAVGEGMSGVTKAQLSRLPDTAPTGAISTNGPQAASWQDVEPLQVTPRSVKFVVPAAWKAGVFACRLAAGAAVSKTFLVNAPDPWWLQGDSGDGAAPGGWVRIFGKSLNFGGRSSVMLRDTGGKSTLLPVTTKEGTSLSLVLPKTLAPGSYSVFVHNGTGGNAAWAKAGVLQVRLPDAWPQQVFNVMDFYGAKADAEIEKGVGKWSPALDRTEAIQAALKKAKDNGGGVVYFPEGTYAIDGQLVVPPHTTLRGAGMGLVILWWGKKGFGLDGGSSERRLDDTSTTPPNLITGGEFRVEDLSLYTPRKYDSVIVAGDNFRMQRVRVRVDRYWIRSGEREEGTTVLMGNGSRVTDCDLLGKGVVFALSSGRNILIARNRVMAGKSPFSLQRSDGVIIEDNEVVSLDPTAYINLSNEGRNLYYARNRHESFFVQQSDFSWTFDGYGVAYQGKAASVDGTHVTLAKDPTYPQWAGESDSIWRRAVVCVIEGKGTGQYRFVTANKGRNWEIDRPFDVAPDAASTISVVPFRGRVLLVGNRFEDASWVNLGYGTSIDVLFTHNSLYRAGALLNYGLRDPDGTLPSWFVQYLDNDIYEGHTMVQTTSDMRNGNVFSGPATRAAIHRRQHLHGDNSGSFDVGGNASDVIMEQCKLENPRSRFTVGKETSGVLLRNNVFPAGITRYSGEGISQAVVKTLPAR